MYVVCPLIYIYIHNYDDNNNENNKHQQTNKQHITPPTVINKT